MNRSGQYIIKKNEPLANARVDSFFFHRQSFVERNKPKKLISYALFDKEKLLAKIYFEVQESIATSLPQSPFGSFDFVKEIEYSQLTELTNYIILDLRNDDVTSIKITSFPRSYEPLIYDKIDKAMCSCGFRIQTEEINQYLEINGDFKDNIQPSQRRYLNFAQVNQVDFKELNIKNLNKAYELIVASRLAKNYPVTMTYEQLTTVIKQFNNAYYLFGLFDGDEMIASAVCIAINNQILYDFYHGDDLNYRKHSPVVPLIDHITQFARTHGFKQLDLGVSTEDGKINKGLFNFKKNIGAQPSKKATYQLDL